MRSALGYDVLQYSGDPNPVELAQQTLPGPSHYDSSSPFTDVTTEVRQEEEGRNENPGITLTTQSHDVDETSMDPRGGTFAQHLPSHHTDVDQ